MRRIGRCGRRRLRRVNRIFSLAVASRLRCPIWFVISEPNEDADAIRLGKTSEVSWAFGSLISSRPLSTTQSTEKPVGYSLNSPTSATPFGCPGDHPRHWSYAGVLVGQKLDSKIPPQGVSTQQLGGRQGASSLRSSLPGYLVCVGMVLEFACRARSAACNGTVVPHHDSAQTR